MTPTNEAGHGLPELPATLSDDFKGDDAKLIESAKSLIYLSDRGAMVPHGIGGHARTIMSAFIVRMESALALSRGVPADMVLVPREPTEAMIEAGHAAYEKALIGNRRNISAAFRARWLAMIKAAPAAAGAQGEVEAASGGDCNCASGRGAEHCVIHASAAWDTPQPAAADGGVRERARELLADAQQRADGHGVNARLILDEGMSLRCNVACDVALHAVSAALSSHRQAGDVLARGWFHALPDDDDYEFHDDASGAGKNCPGCIRAMIVTEESAALVEKGAG